MTTQDLLSKELSNTYAISKQIVGYFNGSEIDFLSEKTQLLLVDYLKLNCTNEELTLEALRSLEINPGNTSDSIVEEITANLGAIVNEDIKDDVKGKGYLLSLNRLLGYQIANIQNVKFIGGEGEVLNLLFKSESELKDLKKNLFS